MHEIERQTQARQAQAAHVWLSHRPGLFERPSERECKAAILASFTVAYPLCSEAMFWESLKVAGFEVRATPTGGYILDWVPR